NSRLETRNLMENPWIIPAMAGLAVLWLASLAAMRFWTRRRMLADFMARPGGCELPRPSGPRPEDRAALEIIRSRRRRYLWSRWPETALSFYAIQEMSLEIMKEIAGVYYPREEEPQLKASLADLLDLHNRVGSWPAGLGFSLAYLPGAAPGAGRRARLPRPTREGGAGLKRWVSKGPGITVAQSWITKLASILGGLWYRLDARHR